MPSESSGGSSGGDWQLVHFIECLPDALLVAGMDGRIQLVNSRLATLFGYTRDELVGLPVEALMPSRLREHHAALREGFASSPRDRPMGSGTDIIGQHKDGTEFRADVELRIRDTPRGRAVLAVVRDLGRASPDDREGDVLQAHVQRTRELYQLVLAARVALDDSSDLLSQIRASAGRAVTALPDGAAGRVELEEILRATDDAARLLDDLRARVARQTASAAGITSKEPEA